MNAAPKNLIFDFDGTIADTLPVYLAALATIEQRNRNFTVSQTAQLRQMPLQKVFRHLKASPLARLRVLAFHLFQMQQAIPDAVLWNGVGALVPALKQQGHHLFILSSNYRRNVQAFLHAKGLESYFEGIYHVRFSKKAIGLRDITKQGHLTKSRTYYIANEPSDMRAAAKAGVHGVAVLWSGQDRAGMAAQQPIALLTKPEQLLRLVER